MNYTIAGGLVITSGHELASLANTTESKRKQVKSLTHSLTHVQSDPRGWLPRTGCKVDSAGKRTARRRTVQMNPATQTNKKRTKTNTTKQKRTKPTHSDTQFTRSINRLITQFTQ